MALVNPSALPDVSRSIPSSRHFSWTVGFPFISRFDSHDSLRRLYDIHLPSRLEELHLDDINTFTTLNCTTQHARSERATATRARPSCPQIQVETIQEVPSSESFAENAKLRRPFSRWMKSLHRRVSQRDYGNVWSPDTGWENLECSGTYQRSVRRRLSRRLSSSGSSLGFIEAVQSASISIASASAISRSHRHHRLSNCRSRTERSSRASLSAPRFSEDSIPFEKVSIDVAAVQRSLRRRQIIEELISTEESYIGDIRFLIHTYINLLAALPTLPERLRSSINHNLDQILQLHEEILGELHRVVPDSEYSQADHLIVSSSKSNNPKTGHRRWSSLDMVSGDQGSLQLLQKEPGVLSEPQVAADVAKIFSKRMHCFFMYQEYGAKYEMMIKDATSALENLPEWELHQKGLEAFAFTMEPSPSSDSRKALTIGDLLVKPIQRICKYPLLFAELLRCTPVIDCPNSHMEVETTLMRLREATAEMNRSTEDNLMKGILEKTWLLQDRIVFPNRRLDAHSKNQVRSFGHIQLCGVLHVCWQSPAGVDGQYMICLLYKDVLCLASGGKLDPIYTIMACIDVHCSAVEDADNGRGLQCHLAPFSWKLVFESDHQLYEVVMTACTSREENEWRTRLQQPLCLEPVGRSPGLQIFLSLDIQSLGTVFGRPGSIARSLSTHQASVGSPESSLCHVILKNTSTMKSSSGISSVAGLHRSQSLLSTKVRTPVLVPSRSERARLEVLLSDVWSQDVLPLPSMTNIARNEQMIRRSASTVMRKLSVSSITKRSGSLSRRTIEDPSSEDQVRQTSFSSDSGFDIFDKAGREESSHSYTSKGSALPETRELSEEDDHVSDMSPRLELTQISELEPLNLMEIMSDKQLQSEAENTPTLQDCMTNRLQINSPQNGSRTATHSVAKENLSRLANATAVQSTDVLWGKEKGSKNEKKCTGIRRFFR
ncbi:uncharacterized protein FPRO_00677 [Fusarium proliferatum ET1]|uniref:DH domain-containing protein n=1 Tax=Fusarium proliferatum (strain ET1) TaxID=1227346 RepID=A0A1L7V2Y0_FUSPR|nr:uncharacterized protein FPRO_00677 [Fusarium proliferatum ET1]CZR35201.1 uncharacterized protein FPRO_00677 [Fusarium proliferatum ET1]